MTITAAESAAGNRSISAERAAAAALPAGSNDQHVAYFRVDELEYARDVQRVAATRIALQCVEVDKYLGEGADRRLNPNAPFRVWDCCDTHRGLKRRREALAKRADELGVETTFGSLTNAVIVD